MLLSGCAAQIDAGGFDALMPHQIGQQRYVVELLQKVLGIAVPERMRIDDLGVQVIFRGKVLQLLCNAASGYPFPKAIEKQIAALPFVGSKPFQRLIPQLLGNEQTAYLATLGVEVIVPPTFTCSTFSCTSSLTLAPVAARKRTTKYHSRFFSFFNLFFRKV